MGQLGWLVLPLLMVGAWGCHSDRAIGVCRYDGTSHALGDSFPANDNCNTCSCSSLGISCTHRTCLPDAAPPDVGSVDAAEDQAAPSDGGPSDSLSDGGPVDGPVTCQSGSHVYAQGVVFPSDDGCNFCSCSTDGRILCTAVFCADGGGSALGCDFETTYRYSDVAKMYGSVVDDWSTLSPPHHDQVIRRNAFEGTMHACDVDLPCIDSTRVDVVEIRQALAHPDVVAALAQPSPPSYGGTLITIFRFQRDDGRGFNVGDVNGGNVPPGLQALVDLLHMVHSQTTATCPGL